MQIESDYQMIITQEMEDTILNIIKHGGTAEVKKENGKLVIVEIKRKAVYKQTDTQ